MKEFPLTSRSETTALKLPKELYSFSRNLDATWNIDEEVSKTEALSYFYMPDSYTDKGFSLVGGIQNFNRIPESMNVADFTSYLRSIQNHEQATGKKIKTDIITFRGVMTKLLTLIYNTENSVELYAIAFDQQLFIKNDDEVDFKRREAEAEKLAGNPEKQKHLEHCEFAGYKFEALTTLPKPWAQCSRSLIEKRDKKVVNNYEQYISVVKTGIGKVKTLLAGEVDCIWDYIPESKAEILQHYVELKTSRVVETPHQAIQFERKLFRTWAQCFLLGIKRIVYGYRDDNHILKNIEVFDTEEVPVLIKENEIPRNEHPKILCVEAIKWYGALLEWLIKSIDLTDELVAYKISYDASTRSIRLKQCSDTENESLRNGGLLTKEFKEWRGSIRKN